MELDKKIKESSLQKVIDLFISQHKQIRKIIFDKDYTNYNIYPESTTKLYEDLSSKLFTHYFTIINYIITNNIKTGIIDGYNKFDISSLFIFDESLIFDDYNFEYKIKLLKLIAPYKNSADEIVCAFFKNKYVGDVLDFEKKNLLKILKLHVENGIHSIGYYNKELLKLIGIDFNKIINNDFQQKVIHVVLGAKGSLPFHLANNIYAYLRVK